jgi:hypothetical protein
MGAIDPHIADLANIAIEKLSDPFWRLFSGELYKIIIKDEKDPDAEGLVLPFKPNRAQRRFIKRLWNRNIILKARQLGFTTMVAILWLDFALFNPNVRCGIIAQDDGSAQTIFRDKVKFPYENLPEAIKMACPLKNDNMHEMVFAHNNSSIRVATSMRSGTYHRLHVSEFGKICAKYPEKAAEVISGSIPSVPLSGIVIIESTAEGTEGPYYNLTQAAIKLFQQGSKLTQKQWRFHFFAWFDDEKYRMDPAGIFISKKDHDYFERVEADMKVTLDEQQRAWYVSTRNDFADAGMEEKMLQEYPSTPKEAFQKSIEGTYYAQQMAKMRLEGRICKIPILDIPCNTFWDIGGTAGTAIWVHQTVGLQEHLIAYYEAHNESFAHAVRWINSLDYIWNKHFLPHDAEHRKQGKDQNQTAVEILEELGLDNIEAVPPCLNLDIGIDQTKKHFPSFWIDEELCAEGIKRIDGYKRKHDPTNGTWRNEPNKYDGNSEGADALRQLGQAKELKLLGILSNVSTMGNRPPPDWRV